MFQLKKALFSIGSYLTIRVCFFSTPSVTPFNIMNLKKNFILRIPHNFCFKSTFKPLECKNTVRRLIDHIEPT